MDDRIMTVSKVADILRINYKTRRRWLVTGRMLRKIIGDNSWRILEFYLREAALKGNTDAVRLLIKAGENMNVQVGVCDWQDETGCTPLHMSAQTGHIAIVRLLIEAGADVNVRNDNGHTPLHKAALKGHIAIVRLLEAEGGY